ncbi:MAG TPA: hypothetical protein VH331_05900 [Allosphingosinicella sp.]|jgi:hypothetical protein|nr:hypothetical protein [Allosphingosinicella sp.]
MSKPAPLSPSVSTLLRLPTENRLSALEWSVVALAERDDVDSLKAPGRIARAFASLFPSSRGDSGGDPRLEALRRITILTHRMGEAVPLTEIRRFLKAGFSIGQYATVANSLGRSARP